jgi:hypothetical protein
MTGALGEPVVVGVVRRDRVELAGVGQRVYLSNHLTILIGDVTGFGHAIPFELLFMNRALARPLDQFGKASNVTDLAIS